jgi:hypothetical protein
MRSLIVVAAVTTIISALIVPLSGRDIALCFLCILAMEAGDFYGDAEGTGRDGHQGR